MATETITRPIYCNKCGTLCTDNPAKISPGYFTACLECDEDLYHHEVHTL